jgi:hypothetical protein
MTAPRVVILYEDKTAGGLHDLISAMVHQRRAAENRPRLDHFEPIPKKGNANLLKGCKDYSRIRFHGPHHADHVMAVIDAYQVEDAVTGIPVLKPATLSDWESLQEHCDLLEQRVCAYMKELAFASMDEKSRTLESERFHPRVLFWECESIFLAGSETLRETRGLRLPEDKVDSRGILRTRSPTAIIKEAWKSHSSFGYSKANSGPLLFADLRRDKPRWPTLLERIPCLSKIIDTLVNL